jgi:predicted 3-demethylubiquinone-9 3-methyltransferase (glyoxalase superfamily)
MTSAEKITPWFDFKAEEAVDHYLSIFGNGRVLLTTRYGEAGPGPDGAVMIFEMNKLDIAKLHQAFGPNQEEVS